MAVQGLRVYESSRTRKVSNNEVEEEVEYFFDKKYAFQKPEGGWPILSPEKMFTADRWKIPQMMTLKQELNSMKNRLNDYNLQVWHKHTRSTNTAGNVIWSVRKLINPEFVTQAWCKFYEILSSYAIIPKLASDVGILNTVHLCETPGAFIAALNHFLKLNHRNLKWDWIATSLNPHHEENPKSIMLPDDRFLLFTLDKWKFGPDQTGNIMDRNNFLSLVAESQKLGPILLVTADGSVDCMNQPDEQETTVNSLMFCEAVAALHILSAGGTFVMKMFTTYEHSSICLVYFLNNCFEEVHVFKPVTSKEGNSETYVVCINYDGTDDRKEWLRKLRCYYGPKLPDKAMFPLLLIPEDFIEQLLQCAERFKTYQEEVLEQNILLFTIQHEPSVKRLQQLRHRIADVFLQKCKLHPLKSEQDEVVGKTRLANVLTLQMDPREDSGSFNENRKLEQLPRQEKLAVMLQSVQSFKPTWDGDLVKWFKLPSREENKFSITFGKPVNVVRTSKFCSGKLLELRYQINLLSPPAEEDAKELTFSRRLPDEMKYDISNFFPELFKESVQVIDFGDTLWTSSHNHHEFEQAAFQLIGEELENAWRDSNIILIGFPMLTQFSVGLIFFWAHLFEQVGFLKPNGDVNAIIFRNFRSRNRKHDLFCEQLRYETESRDDDKTKGVHSIIPINELVRDGDLYATIVAVNTFLLQNLLSKKVTEAIRHNS